MIKCKIKVKSKEGIHFKNIGKKKKLLKSISKIQELKKKQELAQSTKKMKDL